MKRLIQALMIGGIILVLLIAVAAYCYGVKQTSIPEGGVTTAPSRMLMMGPVIGGVVSIDAVGEVTVMMEASRLRVKKTRTFGFDNALFRKFVADDFLLTVSKDGERLLALSKGQAEISADRKIIDIDTPRVSFPPDMTQPDSIRLDKTKMTLYIRTDGTEEIWDLEKI